MNSQDRPQGAKHSMSLCFQGPEGPEHHAIPESEALLGKTLAR